jgi:hypothetical protein
MAEHEMAKVRHAAARKQHESQRAEQVQIEQVVDQQIASGEIALQNLMQARAGKTTQIATALLPAAHKPIQPMPTPPSQLFVPMSYQSGDLKLNAFVTPDPRDGRKLPLMVWLTGEIPIAWTISGAKGQPPMTKAPALFARLAWRCCFPHCAAAMTIPASVSISGGGAGCGSSHPAGRTAALCRPGTHLSRWAQHRSHAGFADGDGRVASSGVFAFGPVDEVGGYGWPVKWGLISADEKRLRSPVYWLHAIKSPTWIIEGSKSPGNINSLDNMCAARKSNQLHCVSVQGLITFPCYNP